MRQYKNWSVLILVLLIMWSCGQQDVEPANGELTAIIKKEAAQPASQPQKESFDLDEALAKVNKDMEQARATLQQGEKQRARLDSILHPPQPKVDPMVELAKANKQIKSLVRQQAKLADELEDLRAAKQKTAIVTPAPVVESTPVAFNNVNAVNNDPVGGEVFVFHRSDGAQLWGDPIGWDKSDYQTFDGNQNVSVPATVMDLMKINGISRGGRYLDNSAYLQVSLYQGGKQKQSIKLDKNNILTEGTGKNRFSNYIFRFDGTQLIALTVNKNGEIVPEAF